MKTYTVTHWGKFAPPAYLSNGFIGLRVSKNPFKGIQGLLSGFTGVRKGADVQALCVIATPELSFTLDGQPAAVEPLSQSYDFSCAELTTEVKLTAGGKSASLSYTLFCPRRSPTLLCGLLKRTGGEGAIEAALTYSVIDSHKHTVSEIITCGFNSGELDGKALLVGCDRTTSAGLAFKVYGANVSKNEPLKAVFALDGECSIVTSYVPSVMHSEPHNQAHRMIKLATWSGVERIREQNRAAWDELWKGRVTLEGAGEGWQEAVDASYFYLMSSASEYAPASVAPFGLSNADAYEGHCFWDTESFMFMPPLFCAPKIAESMLNYRFERLGAAQSNARLNGYDGAQYPWQSGATGSEVTVPWAGQAGGAGEQHITLDVALAFDGYVRLSGNMEFLREKAWPVLREVAKWIASRVEKTGRGYEILHVTGIDEESDDVANDSYTNLMSARLLREAAKYSEMLGLGDKREWTKIADSMYIPVKDGVLQQYEGMPDRETQRPTTLMSYFPYGHSDGEQADFATIKYYVDHNMEDYLRYPMQSGYLGLFPAWLGRKEQSLDFYAKANLTFFCDPFYACTEWSIADPADRIDPKQPMGTSFMTARGSLLSGLIMGLTKLCPWKGDINSQPNEWLGRNITLPSGWKSVTLGRIFIHGKPYKAVASDGAEKTVLIPLDE